MSTKDKKNVASQALLEMDYIAESLKNESKNTLKSLLGEAVKRALREGCDDDEDDDKDYEITGKDDKEEPKDNEGSTKTDTKENVDDVENPQQMQQAQQQQAQQPVQQNAEQGAYQQEAQPEEMGAEEGPELGAQGEGEGEEEGWDDFSGYKVGDNTYDLTGENDYDKVVKVYKLLQDDDQVVVKKDGDSIHLTDNGAGTEYLIDLGTEDDGETEAEPDSEGNEYYNDEEMGNEEELNESELFEFDDDIAGFPNGDDDDEFDDEENDDFENDEDSLRDLSIYDGENGLKDEWPDDNLDDDFELDSDENYEDYPEINENRKKTRKPMKESKELIFEVDLGYTDNYQDKDPIQGLSNDEPSKGRSWHKGVPTGTKKPWAGSSKDKGAPFKETQKVQGSVNEEEIDVNAMPGENAGELEEHIAGAVEDRAKGKKTWAPNNLGKHGASAEKNNASVGSEYVGKVEESKQLKSIKNENRELKKAILELRNSLNEAYITNVNLGKITKLFLENATSESEKIDIINRFSNEAKTVEQSKALYESISRELKSANKSMNLNETSATANGTKKLNEEKVYKSNDLLKTIDLMNRVSNI